MAETKPSQILLRLDADLIKRLKIAAIERDFPNVSAAVADAIEKWLGKEHRHVKP